MFTPTFTRTRRAVALAALGALAACTDPTSRDGAAPMAPTANREHAARPVPASVEWNDVARGLVAKNRSTVIMAFRVYALTSVAQLEALQAARRASSKGHEVSRRAAIAAASATVLSSLYSSDATLLETLLAQQLASADWLERGHVDADAGEAAGRAAGTAVIQHAATDGYGDAWTDTVPTGPGVWFSSATPPAPPAGASTSDARTWFLRSPDQFRPSPPPAFGSSDFLAALAEVRQISDTRTHEQDSIAKFWGFGAGTHTPPGYWNEQATTLAVRYHMGEARATWLLATMNMVAMDAFIASNDAKLTYWLLRPSQADPAITLAIAPLPNFPAYPSNHATISAAMAEVIAATFPKEARELRAAADQAALSRVYGGIHYRFDGEAGLALGRRVARFALRQGGAMRRDVLAPDDR